MKTTFIPLPETEEVSRAENETQRVLREALMRLGPNGEKWSPVACMGDKYCSWLAIKSILDEGASVELCEVALIFSNVVGGKYLDHVFKWNDAPERTFSDVRSAFLKAIELAADQPGGVE